MWDSLESMLQCPASVSRLSYKSRNIVVQLSLNNVLVYTKLNTSGTPAMEIFFQFLVCLCILIKICINKIIQWPQASAKAEQSKKPKVRQLLQGYNATTDTCFYINGRLTKGKKQKQIKKSPLLTL